VCTVEEPLLEPKQGGNEAACHFPLSDEDLRERVAAAGVKPDPREVRS
jgi:hypothetical protein